MMPKIQRERVGRSLLAFQNGDQPLDERFLYCILNNSQRLQANATIFRDTEGGRRRRRRA